MKTCLCVGDSHARLFGTKPGGARFRYDRLSPTRLTGFNSAYILSIKGATAAGFRPKSGKLSSFTRTARAIKRTDPDLICFGFGQVDAEQSCYFMAIRDGLPLETAIQLKAQALRRYLRFCRRAANSRPFVIKGLNPVTLHDDGALHRMLLRTLPVALDLPRQTLADWLDRNAVTVESHRAINAAPASDLRKTAEALSFPYFDLRDETSMEERHGLAKPEFCGHARDVHLRCVPEIETRFAAALWTTAKAWQLVP